MAGITIKLVGGLFLIWVIVQGAPEVVSAAQDAYASTRGYAIERAE